MSTVCCPLGEERGREGIDLIVRVDRLHRELRLDVVDEVWVRRLKDLGGAVVREERVADFLWVVDEVQHVGRVLACCWVGAVESGERLNRRDP